MNILLLGGTGYLGRFVLNSLIKQNISVSSPSRQECDLKNADALINYFNDFGPFDIVINCAVYQKTGDLLVKDAKKIFRNNTKINNTFLFFLEKVAQPLHFVTLGASCAVSSTKKGENYFDGPIHPSVACFAAPKRQLAQILNFDENNNHTWAVILPGTLIGPGEQINPDKKHFFNGAIYRAVKSKSKKDTTFEIFGNMDASRELSSVSLVAAEVVRLALKQETGIIPLQPDFLISVGQLFDYLINNVLLTADHSMKETSFNAQTKKTIGMAVKYNLTGQNLSEHLPFEEIVQKTISYYEALTTLD
jgi:nucleoside-diphosphate-sugar epimerase